MKKVGGIAGLLILLAVAVAWSGLAGVYSQSGFYGPAWSTTAGHLVYFRRQTRGIVIGPGQEFFTPPAEVLVLADTMTLIDRDLASGEEQVLGKLELTPHVDRWVSHYHGRIFGVVHAAITAGAEGVDFNVDLGIPTQPLTTTWRIDGAWRAGQWRTGDWQRGEVRRVSEPVLVDGLEVLLVPGPEGYGGAMVTMNADAGFNIVAVVPDFDPAQVDRARLASLSRRRDIERVRHLTEVRDRLQQQHESEGMREGEASLATISDMESMGLLPLPNGIIANKIDKAPAESTVFTIPADYFRVGLFQDLQGAMATPGKRVRSSTGDYLVYANDNIGVRLRNWRADHKQFYIRVDGQVWKIREISGPNRK